MHVVPRQKSTHSSKDIEGNWLMNQGYVLHDMDVGGLCYFCHENRKYRI